MATVSEGQLPFAAIPEESSSEPTDAIVFFGVSLLLGITSRQFLRGTRVPYTVALLVIGIALGSLEYGTDHRLGRFGAGIRIWASINPDLLLAVFLPSLLFEGSFLMEANQIKCCIAQMLILAGPGVLISTFCLGSALKLLFPYNWNWKTSLLLGGLLSATDPVAVVALLKELGTSKKLSTIIEGESMMNDGVAIVVYQLFYRMVLGESFSVGSIVAYLAQVTFGAVGIGLAFGVASVLWFGFIFNDVIIEIALTLSLSYLAYFTAQDGADVSGVLTVTTLGMFFSAVAGTAFKGDSQKSLLHFWEMVSYIANTLIFILSGVIIAEGVLQDDDYVFKHVVGTLYPCLRYFGYGLDWKEATILVWSGLRGAVALSMSLSVKHASDDSAFLSQETGTLFHFFTSGIVLLTLIVNGSTSQFILHLLEMDKLSTTKKYIMDYTKYEMMNKALECFGDLGDDEELGPADWPSVEKYIGCLSNLGEELVHSHSVSKKDYTVDSFNLKDMRRCLLNGVHAAYSGMLDQQRITQTTGSIMMQSVEQAHKLVSSEPLCDWNCLKSYVQFPSYYKLLQLNTSQPKLATYFMVEQLESACHICAAFLQAHRIARRQLHDFIGDWETATSVINESKEEGEEAKSFLEEVCITFPQVLHTLKTRQVAYIVLKHLSDYVENLEKVGLLEEKEMHDLRDAVQTDLKKVMKNPPLTKTPKTSDMLKVHPLMASLPSMLHIPIEGSSKELTKQRGVTLCKEGTRPNGIWLISNGVVMWESKVMKNKHSIHPTFSHGSTLGLYEVLTGKPYICSMITDSLLLYGFVETENIHSLLRTDSTAEDILWQESVIVLAKILLPQVFEEMAMQELRSLVLERSILITYTSGEIIEIPHYSVAFLLEGFIKPQNDQGKIVTSPAMLLPCGALSFLSLEESGSEAASFYHQQSCYLVETRARVILLDVATLEAKSRLHNSSSSWVISADLTRSPRKRPWWFNDICPDDISEI